MLYHPTKSVRYFENRYARHPFYRCRFFAVHHGSVPFALIAVRKVDSQGSSCLRIADVLGDLSASGCWYDSVQKLLQREGAECLDCLSHDIGDNVVVIPHFFEPLGPRNITIRCAWKSEREPYVFFKGDFDQNGPNQLQPTG